MEKRKKRWSLRSRLMMLVIVSWILPVILVSTVFGILINAYYTDTIQKTMEAGVQHAMKQVEIRMEDGIVDSKSVSYDGKVRSAYREYGQDGDAGHLYREVREYLTGKFSRSDRFEAVYVAFMDEELDAVAYMVSPDMRQYRDLQHFRQMVLPKALSLMADVDTEIRFMELDGELFMVRNILDSHFVPYAMLVMQCSTENLLQSLESIVGVTEAVLQIDGIRLTPELGEQKKDASAGLDEHLLEAECIQPMEEHELVLSVKARGMNIMKAIPMLRWTIFVILLMILPLLLLVIWFCHHQITGPVALLSEASDRVQNGERGYQIETLPDSKEFSKLCRHFNTMSSELQNQFERLYEEQQALAQAKVRALQSQIDPHFLNNTLEIINWEARMEGNDRVSAMIEALSTMLGASIGRDGRARIPLREELQYADAYLYIIGQRLGDRLKVVKEIDESLLDRMIPRLMIQPLVENAINHDIADSSGVLSLRIRSENGFLTVDVEHDGHISDKDRERIDRLLSDKALQPGEKGGRVGIRNVNQRIRLIYGEKAEIHIEEVVPGKVLARIQLPDDVQLD